MAGECIGERRLQTVAGANPSRGRQLRRDLEFPAKDHGKDPVYYTRGKRRGSWLRYRFGVGLLLVFFSR